MCEAWSSGLILWLFGILAWAQLQVGRTTVCRGKGDLFPAAQRVVFWKWLLRDSLPDLMRRWSIEPTSLSSDFS